MTYIIGLEQYIYMVVKVPKTKRLLSRSTRNILNEQLLLLLLHYDSTNNNDIFFFFFQVFHTYDIY